MRAAGTTIIARGEHITYRPVPRDAIRYHPDIIPLAERQQRVRDNPRAVETTIIAAPVFVILCPVDIIQPVGHQQRVPVSHNVRVQRIAPVVFRTVVRAVILQIQQPVKHPRRNAK